jgi:anti-sigma factor RsiW
MRCAEARKLVPGYLDGTLPEGPESHARVSRHLEDCAACAAELDRYVQLSALMSSMTPAAPPADLGVSIRVAISRARQEQGFWRRLDHWQSHARLVLQNIFEPLALPATFGLLAAMLVFAFIYQFLGAGVPLAAATADLPSNLLQPARLETLAGFQVSGLSDSTLPGQHALLVEATVSSAGEAVSYRVISGEVDRTMQRELDQLMLFSRFRPQLSFGRPTSGGRVVLSFSKISVRG